MFESRGTMGEELESLRTVIDDRRVYGDNATNTHSKPLRRRKRFLSYPRYVELMVTADAKMVRHHGRNLEHYILTIMSVVSKIMFLKLFSFYSRGEDIRTFCLSVRALVKECVFLSFSVAFVATQIVFMRFYEVLRYLEKFRTAQNMSGFKVGI